MAIWVPGDSDFALALREPNLLVPGKKPVGLVEVDKSKSITRGLRFAFIQADKQIRYSGEHLELLVGRDDQYVQFANSDTNNYFVPNASAHGSSLATSKVSGSASLTKTATSPAGHFLNNATSLSVLIVRKLGGTSAQQSQFRHDYQFTMDIMSWTAGSYNLLVSLNGAWDLTGNTAVPCDTANDLVVCGAAYGNSSVAWFGQGRKVAQKGAAASISPTDMKLVTDTISSDNRLYAAFMFDRCLSDAEMVSLTRNPYQLLRSANSTPYLLPVAAGGGATEITVTTGALTVAGTNATISQARNVSVSTGALAIAGVNASIGSGTDISVGTGALVVAGTNATISQTRNVVATTGALVIDATAASIEVNRTVSVTTGAIVVAGVNAVVDQQITGATNIIVTTGAVTVTGTAAVINQITELGITTGAIVVSGVNASISTQNAIDVSTGALAITGINAGIIAGTGISVSPGSVTITGYNATITGLVWTDISDTSTTWTPISEASSIWTEI